MTSITPYLLYRSREDVLDCDPERHRWHFAARQPPLELEDRGATRADVG